jgi:hypothetical protein
MEDWCTKKGMKLFTCLVFYWLPKKPSDLNITQILLSVSQSEVSVGLTGFSALSFLKAENEVSGLCS